MRRQCVRCSYSFEDTFIRCPRCGSASIKTAAKPNPAESKTRDTPASKASASSSLPPPPSTSSDSWGGPVAAFLILVVIAIALGVAISSSNSPAGSNQEKDTVAATDPIYPSYYVTADALNVRNGPGISSEVIGTLTRWETIKVHGIKDNWAHIKQSDGALGFASAQYLARGDGRTAYTAYCEQNIGSTPTNGEILSRFATTGTHTIRIRNGAKPTVVKVQEVAGGSALRFYIAPHRSASVSTLPNGTFLVYFASGQGWSRACNRFVQDMVVTKDPAPVTFQVDTWGRSSILEYELTAQYGGNFSPTVTDPRSF